MNRAHLAAPLLVAMLAVFGSSAVFGQITRPGPPTPWNLFGANRAIPKARDAAVNRNGNRPNMERQPPLKRIADPSNLQPEIAPGLKQPEAIKVAAQVKTQEDLKDQKIKGLKYLGTVGCGCYAKKYDIEGAFLEGLDDCTEEVRYEAVKAITAAACGDVCKVCNMNNCCTKKIVEKLAEMAYKQDKEGCWVEPSERVRQAAVNALNVCHPHLQPESGEVGPGVEPGGPRPAPGGPGAADPAPVPNSTGSSNRRGIQPPPLPTASQQLSAGNMFAISDESIIVPPSANSPTPATKSAAPTTATSRPATSKTSTGKTATSKSSVAKTSSGNTQPGKTTVASSTARQSKAAPSNVIKGAVVSVDQQRRLVRLEVSGKQTLPVGTRLSVSHHYLTGPVVLTQLEVIDSAAGIATATPLDMNKFAKVSQGDSVATLD